MFDACFNHIAQPFSQCQFVFQVRDGCYFTDCDQPVEFPKLLPSLRLLGFHRCCALCGLNFRKVGWNLQYREVKSFCADERFACKFGDAKGCEI